MTTKVVGESAKHIDSRIVPTHFERSSAKHDGYRVVGWSFKCVDVCALHKIISSVKYVLYILGDFGTVRKS